MRHPTEAIVEAGPKPNPCRFYCNVANGGEPRGLDRCPFRLRTRLICHVCGLPIFQDENWEVGAMLPVHCRCKGGEAQSRPAYMDKLRCLNGCN